MEHFELSARTRTVVGKQVHGLRRQGQLPAVLYGRHLDQPRLLQVETRGFRRVLAKAGASHLIALKVEGEAEVHTVLVREIQREPISGNLYHVDFLAVSMAEKIRLKVPVVLEGKSPPVERGEGILLQTMDTLEIECLPGDLIDALHVDVSRLAKVGAQLSVADVSAALANVTILAEPDEEIVRVTPLREEEIAEAVEAPEVAEVEVITKGKVEEEEEEAE